MRVFLKTLVSLSLSGSLLILLLLPLRWTLRGRLSQRCQHLLWLAVALRLLLPFSPENSLMSRLFRYGEIPKAQQTEEILPDSAQQVLAAIPAEVLLPKSLAFPGYLYRQQGESLAVPNLPGVSLPVVQDAAAAQPYTQPLEEPSALLSDRMVDLLELLWTVGFLVSVGCRLWAYRRFCRQTAARLAPPPVQALEMEQQLRLQLGLRYPVPLWTSPDLVCPMLMRLDRPCILLPDTPTDPDKLRLALLHELAHQKRHDLAAKMLFQLALCVHWFNPLVYLMVWLAQQDCELACDETALAHLDPEQRLAYGDALLDFSSLAPAPAGSMPLSGDARRLKQRLEAILRFRQGGKSSLVRSAALLTALSCAALYTGAYAGPAPQPEQQAQQTTPPLATQIQQNGSSTLANSTIFYENNYLFVLSPCPNLEQQRDTRKRPNYVLAFRPDCLQWYYDASLINGVDKALSGSSVQSAMLESVMGPYTESAQQLAEKFYQANAPEQFGATIAKAPAAVKQQFAWQAYQDKRLEFFSLVVLTLDKQTCQQLAWQALEDREASYLYPLAPLLEEQLCFALADRAARQACYGCFMPLFERMGEQNKLLMGRQAIANRDILRFSMMRGRLTENQRIQLAQVAYDADDLELFSLAVSRFSFQQRQSFLSQAYQDGREEFFSVLQNS